MYHHHGASRNVIVLNLFGFLPRTGAVLRRLAARERARRQFLGAQVVFAALAGASGASKAV